MTSDQTSELFPILAESEQDFEVVMRGYDRRQVDGFVARAEAELAALTSERDSAVSRGADLAAQMANAQAQVESIRRRLSETTGEITPENVHSRVRPMVEMAIAEARSIRESADKETTHLRVLADADAAETRRQAALDAERLREQAQTDLARVTEASRQREADAELTLSDARATAAEQTNRARGEADLLLAQTHAEVEELIHTTTTNRDRLDSEAAAKRVLANEDFEIALRVRRTEEQRVDAERHAAALAMADRLVTDARAESARAVSAANAEATRVIAQAQARVDELTALHRRVHSDLTRTHQLMGETLDHSAEVARTSPMAKLAAALDPGEAAAGAAAVGPVSTPVTAGNPADPTVTPDTV